jgi:hypothetical protein
MCEVSKVSKEGEKLKATSWGNGDKNLGNYQVASMDGREE